MLERSTEGLGRLQPRTQAVEWGKDQWGVRQGARTWNMVLRGAVMTAHSGLLWLGKRLPRGLELHPGEKRLDRDYEVVEETRLV